MRCSCQENSNAQTFYNDHEISIFLMTKDDFFLKKSTIFNPKGTNLGCLKLMNDA